MDCRGIEVIVDTTFIIDLLKNRKEAIKLAKSVENREIIKTTSISAFEIYRGVPKQKYAQLNDFFSNLIMLDFTLKSARLAGEISQELTSKGREIDSEDCMIAALARIHNEILITRNVKHFSRVKNLEIKTY